MRRVLKSVSIIAQYLALLGQEADAYQMTEQPVLFGNGYNECVEDLPVLKVAEENIIRSKADYDAFAAKYPLFVIGAADSNCVQCCNSEPLLQKLQDAIKDKAVFSYPEKHKK